MRSLGRISSAIRQLRHRQPAARAATRFGKVTAAALLFAGASTAAFAQSTFTWIGPNGGDIATAANWDPNGVPNPTTGADPLFGDEMLWDGRTTGDLSLIANTGQVGSSGSAWGLRIRLSPNQVDDVNIRSVVTPQSAGTRINTITIEPGAGAFSLGDNTANVLDILMGGTNPQTHTWVNNSTNPVVIHPNVRWRHGGGGAHTFDFGGSGDWIVNNYFRNNNNAATVVTKSGSGTMYWTGTNVGSAVSSILIAPPVTINEGVMVLRSSDLLAAQNINLNGGVLRYDAATGAGTLSGTISGGGALEMNAGTLTLSGANTFSGPISLNGGELVAGRVETEAVNGPLGQGGTISFNGGTLVYSVNNNFDYSPRFSSAAGQAVRINTAGQSVTLATGLTSAGGSLTKLGSGTLTLSGANSYSGLTVVNAGRLVIGGAAGAGSIIVSNSAALGVIASGGSVAPATLALGSTSGATLEFNNVNSTTTPLIAAGTISAGAPVVVNINSGSFTVGQSYPLISWTGGSAPAVTLGSIVGAAGNLTTNGNTIRLNVTGLAFVWTGLNNGNWDTTTTGNWLQNAVSAVFANGSAALFDDTATGTTNVTLTSAVSPASTTVNSARPYSITSSGGNAITGSGGLTKAGNGSLTLSGGVNSFTGPTVINGGSVLVTSLANGGAPSDIGAASSAAANLVLNGGTLAYSGPAQSSDRLFTLGTGGGTIASSGSALSLNNSGAVALSGAGARTLTLAGSSAEDNTLAASVGDSGGATALTKSGEGRWIVTGNNTNSGTVTISGGTLQVGAGGASGAVGSGNIVNNAALVFNRTGSVTNGTISGSGSVTVTGGGTVVLPGNNTYLGGTTVDGATLQVGNGGASGSLANDRAIVNNGTVIFNTTGSFAYIGAGLISGTGNVIVRGAGNLIKAIGANEYTGWTQIDPGATFQPTEGNAGQLLSSAVTNNGTLKFVAQDPRPAVTGRIVGSGRVQIGANNFNAGSITFHGTNTYTGGTFIGANELILGDAATPGAGAIAGDVIFVNNFDTLDDNPRTLTFNRPDDFTFSGNITTNFTSPQNNRGIVQHLGFGTLTLTGNNTYDGGTLLNGGTLVVGNGGTSGSIGSGPVTLNSLLVFNRAGELTFNGNITGGGSLVKMGTGTVTLNGTNGYFGSTTVSNGVLNINSESAAGLTLVYGGTLGGTGAFVGPVILEAGSTLAPGTATIGTMTMNDLSLGGNLAIDVNKSHPQRNDMIVVAGGLVKNGTGTLTVGNIGPGLSVGDKFTIFNQPLVGGDVMTVTGAGATWQNNLAVDGSITALTVSPTINMNPPVVRVNLSGDTLSLGWPTNRGWILQTNSSSLAATNQWFPYPGSETLTNVNLTIDRTKTNVFFRMVLP